MFTVLTELSLRDEAIKLYLDFVSTKIIKYQVSSAMNDRDRFKQQHLSLNSTIIEVFNNEVSNPKGRILEVFGGELWYRISLELIARYFR
jgi:hypothetical protein